MRNKLIYLPLIAVVLFVLYKLYKKAQYDSMGYKQPQRESIISITTFAKDSVFGHVLIPKDTGAVNFINHAFPDGSCLLLDGNENIISNNDAKVGNCYNNIVKAICNDFNFSKLKKGHYVNGKVFIDSLLKSCIVIGDSFHIDRKYDYVFVYGWAKYDVTSTSEHPFTIKKYLESHTNKKVMVLAVNNDYVDNWFDKNAVIPPLEPFKWF
jgi:hypothetical protein